MMSFERKETLEKLSILNDLTIWSSHTLMGISEGKEKEAADSLGLIIKAMEDPLIVEKSKVILDKLKSPF